MAAGKRWAIAGNKIKDKFKDVFKAGAEKVLYI